mmetsp:Transcript_2676/g.7267  ORF Transcript_2676/g.7267 Transcript_2676/m.7267 type:complete len:211 (+) Transcript_2676:425-1057(+)
MATSSKPPALSGDARVAPASVTDAGAASSLAPLVQSLHCAQNHLRGKLPPQFFSAYVGASSNSYVVSPHVNVPVDVPCAISTCQCGSNTGSAASHPAVAFCRSCAPPPHPSTGVVSKLHRALDTVHVGSFGHSIASSTPSCLVAVAENPLVRLASSADKSAPRGSCPRGGLFCAPNTNPSASSFLLAQNDCVLSAPRASRARYPSLGPMI